ncbi:MAG: hypothetical protein IPJ73_20310 [Zoogloea sp.]|nr:hypothetical protein [Zoogloea sp.]
MQTTRTSLLRRPAVVPTIRLPGLRETATALLRVLSGGAPSAREAARIITLDPVLVFELLQTAPLEKNESASLLEAIAQRIDNTDSGLLQAWALRHIVQQAQHRVIHRRPPPPLPAQPVRCGTLFSDCPRVRLCVS